MIPPTTRILVYGVYKQGFLTTDSCDHRMIHVQRILRRSLVQPWLRAGPALRLDQVSLGLIQLFLETPEDGDWTASQGSCIVWLSLWGKSSSTHSVGTSLVSSSVVSHCPTIKILALPPCCSPHRCWVAPVRCLQSHLFSRLDRSSFLSLSSKGSTPVSNQPVVSCQTHPSSSFSSFYLKESKLGTRLQT